MNELKFSIFNYINHFGIYDYIAFIWLFLTFLILLFLSILFIKKSIKISLILILLSFVLLFVGPFALKYFLNKTIWPVLVSHIKYEKLHFSDTLIVDSDIKNISKKPYNFCQINTKIYRPSNSKFKNFINKLKPIEYRTILSKRELKAGETMQNRTIFYNFSYKGDVNISVDAECYGAKR
ncbi:MAG: DUF2393 family protein [Sulfurospirillum sp.]